jgi:4'-phosphopantetheinyl transferase
VAGHGAVGVDVEEIRPVPDAGALIGQHFSAQEGAELKRLYGAEKTLSFFRIWTRKEAWVKASGEGITDCLASIDVSEPEGQVGSPSAADALSAEAHLCWYDLAPARGFVGALVCSAR